MADTLRRVRVAETAVKPSQPPGLTLAELEAAAPSTSYPHGCSPLAFVLREEVAAGRVVVAQTRYLLVRERFPAAVLAALERLAID